MFDKCIVRHYNAMYRETLHPNITGKEKDKRMTDRNKFTEVIKSHGTKVYEVAFLMGMSPQSLQNKLGNAYPFTQIEMSRFRDIFPDVTDEDFKQIFFAVDVTAGNTK